MHMSFRIGDSILNAADCHCQGKPNFHGISLSLRVDSDADAAKVFAALSDGGTVQMPLGKTFFATSFGMLTDKFGLGWMILAGTQ